MATSLTTPGAGAATVTPPDDFTSSLDSAFEGTESTSTTEESTGDTDTTDVETPEAPEAGDDEIVDPEADEEAATEEETPEETPDAEAEEGQDEAADQSEDSEVKPGEHKGKKGFFLTENRYRNFEAAHKNVREIEAVLNEPLTTEVVQRDRAAFLGQEQMYADFLSADPTSQAKFIKNFADEARRAVAEGDASTDAMVTLAGQLPSVLEKLHPDAHSVLMMGAARKLIDDLLPVAKAAIVPGDKNSAALLYSLQHIEKKLFNGNFTKEADIRLPDPNAQRQSRERSAIDELNELKSRQATESWNRWQNSTNESIRSAVSKEITDAIDGLFAKAPKALAALKKAHPDEYQSVVDLLNSKISAGFKSNDEFRRAIRTDMRNAEIAASEEKRGARAEAIVKRHAFTAKRIVEANLPAIRARLNKVASGALDATHQKRAAASQHRAPSGSAGEFRQSLIPAKNPKTGAAWNPDEFHKQVDALWRS